MFSPSGGKGLRTIQGALEGYSIELLACGTLRSSDRLTCFLGLPLQTPAVLLLEPVALGSNKYSGH